jgi:hypothetical protein
LLFNASGFGPPSSFIWISSWPCIDHLASGLLHVTKIAHFGLAFATVAPVFGLTLQHTSNSPDHYSIGTQSSPLCPKTGRGLPPLVSTRFQVLFHSPPGVLFTFPSRYWFAIGHKRVFSLTQWSGQIHTGLPVSRITWESQHKEFASFRLLDCHHLWSVFPDCSAKIQICNSSTQTAPKSG